MGPDGVYMADIAEIVDTATERDRHVIDLALQPPTPTRKEEQKEEEGKSGSVGESSEASG